MSCTLFFKPSTELLEVSTYSPNFDTILQSSQKNPNQKISINSSKQKLISSQQFEFRNQHTTI